MFVLKRQNNLEPFYRTDSGLHLHLRGAWAALITDVRFHLLRGQNWRVVWMADLNSQIEGCGNSGWCLFTSGADRSTRVGTHCLINTKGMIADTGLLVQIFETRGRIAEFQQIRWTWWFFFFFCSPFLFTKSKAAKKRDFCNWKEVGNTTPYTWQYSTPCSTYIVIDHSVPCHLCWPPSLTLTYLPGWRQTKVKDGRRNESVEFIVWLRFKKRLLL